MFKRILLSLLVSVLGVVGISYVSSVYGDDIYWRNGNVWKNVKVLEYKDGKIKVKRAEDTQWWKGFDRIVFKEIEGEEVAPDVSAKKARNQAELNYETETGKKKLSLQSNGHDWVGASYYERREICKQLSMKYSKRQEWWLDTLDGFYEVEGESRFLKIKDVADTLLGLDAVQELKRKQ